MKKLSLTPDKAVEYLKDNVKIHDNLEISYNRICLLYTSDAADE